MKYVKATRATWFNHTPIRVGQIVELEDEDAARWKRIGIAVDSSEKAFDLQRMVEEEEAANAAEAQPPSFDHSISRQDTEGMQTPPVMDPDVLAELDTLRQQNADLQRQVASQKAKDAKDAKAKESTPPSTTDTTPPANPQS